MVCGDDGEIVLECSGNQEPVSGGFMYLWEGMATQGHMS